MGQKIRFYLDENMPTAVARGLRQRGVDVLTVQEAGLLGASDEVHLQRASNEGRSLVTQDSDFLRLHATGITHPGIVFVPAEVSIGEMVQGLVRIHEILVEKDISGRVEYL